MSGIYIFSSWDIGEEVTAGKLDTDKKTTLGPKAGVNGLTAKDIRIIVIGQNGKAGQKDEKDDDKDKEKDKENKNINATPKAAEFGEQNIINATVYVPNGTLWLREKTEATGSFIARWIVVGEQVELTLSTTMLPTATPTASATATPTATKTEKPTRTPEPTDTPKATKTEKPTHTPEPTDTPKATKTVSSNQSSVTPTRTATTLGSGNSEGIVRLVGYFLQATVTNTATASQVPTTNTQTPTPTVTSVQLSVTPTNTSNASQTATLTATSTATLSGSATATQTPTSTLSASATLTATVTATTAISTTLTATPTLTATTGITTTLTALPTLTATTVITTTLTASPTIAATTAITTTLTASPTITGTVSLTPTATPIATGVITTTITYTYDELYRLTDAVYSNSNEFHYEYDSVGNILTKTVKLAGVTTTTTYTYDDANRLLTVNGVAQQFDANGNLVNDGARTYAYDSANRLKSITQGSNVSSYNYNGMGDRVSQTNNGVTTNYSLDLNAGLTQVLSDGTNNYLYGLGRIGEQQPSGFAYHLGDALGSVRQLVDAGGVVQLTRSYEPYGTALSSVGNANSVYGFTGEQLDSYIKLYYLRSRWLSTDTARFTSKDSWQDYSRPLSLNGWSYVEGNPINLTDPSGMITCEDSTDATCIAMAQDLKTYALALKASVKSGSLLPVEAYAQLADRATINFKDVAGVMWGMTNVLVGVDPNAIEVWKTGLADKYKVQIKTAASPYYIDQDWLPYKQDPSKNDPARNYRHSEIGDWRVEYWDNTPNQAFHSWYFVAVQFYNGSAYGNAANIAHDPYFLEPLCGDDLKDLVKGVKSIPRIGPGIASNLPNFGETSKEDYLLSQKAMELGSGLWWAFNLGPVKVPGSISDSGQWIRANFQNQQVVSPSPSNSGK